MNDFGVEWFDRNLSRVAPPANLRFQVQPFSVDVEGGPDQAKITVTGQAEPLWLLVGWLRYGLRIKNGLDTLCWAGYLHEIEITVGATTFNLSLEQMANRVAVKYSYQNAGVTVDGVTNWSQDNFSVANFGLKELIESRANCPPASAAARQATALATYAYPLSAPPSIDDPAATPTATLYARGWFATLDWRYYAQPVGKLVATNGGANQVLGWGFTAPLGFKSYTIYQIDAKWAGLPNGSRVQISGLAANNGAFTLNKATTDAVQTRTDTSIAFDVTDDILDTNAGLAFVRNKEMIQVTGSAANSHYHIIKTTAADHITVDTTYGGTITHEAAGPSITIRQGNSIGVVEAVTTATPGSNATVVAHGMKLDQRVTPSVAGSFTPGEVLLRIKKVGNPTDAVKVSLQTDSAGLASGTIMDSATVAGSTIGTDYAWFSWGLGLVATWTYGTNYHIVVERTGANSNTDYYLLDMDEAVTYGAGTCKLWTGAAWVSRPTDACLAFQVWGWRETTQQLVDIVSAAGQFGVNVTVQTPSGLNEVQYRDGQYSALTEFKKLLEKGTASGARLLAMPWPGTTNLRIYQEPTSSPGNNLLLRSDGRFYQPGGAPLEPGLLPVGQWVTLADVPPEANSVMKVSPIFIEAAEFDPQSGRVRPTRVRGSASIYQVGGTRQG